MQPGTQVYSLAPDFGARQETLGPGIHRRIKADATGLDPGAVDTVRISEMTVGNKPRSCMVSDV